MAGKTSKKQTKDPDILAQLTAQRDLALGLSAAKSLDDALALCLETAMRVSAMDCGSAYLLDEDSESYILVCQSGLSENLAVGVSRWERGSPRWEMINSGQATFIVFDKARLGEFHEFCLDGLRAVAIIPIFGRGKVIACLNLGSHTLEDLPIANRLSLETIAIQTGSAIARLRSEAAMLEGGETFHQFMDNLPGFALIHDDQNNIIYANRRAHNFQGTPTLVGKPMDILMPPEVMENISRTNQEALVEGLHVNLANMRDGSGHEHILIIYKFPIQSGEKTPVFGDIVLDITDRRKAEEKIQVQLDHLASLRTIDLAITSSLNLDVTLDVLMKETIEQFGVDAVAVLLPGNVDGGLKMKAALGLPNEKAIEIGLFLAEGIGHLAVNSRQPQKYGQEFLINSPLAEEGYVECLAVPLVAKDTVRGALVLLSRLPLSPGSDWFEFLDTVSTQAAIAIENITQYEDLQNVNVTLTEAYDKTIEGWARTLELRDQETANHMQRVVDMTERIAHSMNYPESEMTNLRRGAVLHDIGKIAIPDYIFFKPGALNEAEWKIMRRHPEFARSMMAQIDFLSASVDIPWAHHEHWDGTGYPRGLKGEEIPLAARIFAVADVWDALHADRPYREAWTPDEALVYIKDQSGKQFDPRVVEEFLKIIGKE
jgi:PAS domain S-box-containing protein